MTNRQGVTGVASAAAAAISAVWESVMWSSSHSSARLAGTMPSRTDSGMTREECGT